MPKFIALQSFDDGKLGKVKRGATLDITQEAAKPYKKNGLLDDKEHPQSAAAQQSSASQAARALPQMTPKKPAPGAKKGRQKEK